MKKCEKIQKELVAYLDDELSQQTRSQVEEHLSACESCSKRLYELRLTIEQTANLPAALPSKGLSERFEQRFAKEKNNFWKNLIYGLNRPKLVLATSLAASLLLILVVIAIKPSEQLSSNETELAIAKHLDLFSDYEAIENLDILEDLEFIEALDENA